MNDGDPIRSIEERLPNGLHDAALCELCVNREKGEVVLVLGVDVNPGGTDDHYVHYRRCRIVLGGVPLLTVETLDLAPEREVDLSVEVSLVAAAGEVFPAGVPAGTFLYRIFLNRGHSSIYFGAREASIEWLE